MVKIADLIKAAKKQGWRVEQRGSGHTMFFPPEKVLGIVTVSGTPSDYRALKNIVRDLKERGLKI